MKTRWQPVALKLVPTAIAVIILNCFQAEWLVLGSQSHVPAFGWPFIACVDARGATYGPPGLYWDEFGLLINGLFWFLLLYTIYKRPFRFRLSTVVIALLEGSILLGVSLAKDRQFYWLRGWPWVYQVGQEPVNLSAVIKNVAGCVALVYLTAIGIEWLTDRFRSFSPSP